VAEADRGVKIVLVIACDKREAFAQGSEATKQSIVPQADINSLQAFGRQLNSFR
jgi:hypothetical protein